MFITAVKQRLKLNLVAVVHVMVFGATRTQIETVASLPARTQVAQYFGMIIYF